MLARPVASSIIGGHIFIYSCSAQLVSFEIDCFYGLRTRIYEYVPPPPPIIELAMGLQANSNTLLLLTSALKCFAKLLH